AAYGWSFPFVFQMLACAGNAVVFCNPPGSQSYSQEFATSVLSAWGERDFPCFMALVDRAIEDRFADPKRLGVGGGSYGGACCPLGGSPPHPLKNPGSLAAAGAGPPL